MERESEREREDMVASVMITTKDCKHRPCDGNTLPLVVTQTHPNSRRRGDVGHPTLLLMTTIKAQSKRENGGHNTTHLHRLTMMVTTTANLQVYRGTRRQRW